MDNFMPHGCCLMWNPVLLWLFVLGNAAIATAYFSIPLTLWLLIRKRKDLSFKWMYACFGAFIVFCGMTHIIKIWTMWNPMYWLEAGMDLLTGIISVVTAILLWRLLPNILALPGPDMQLFQKKFDLMPQLGWTAKADGDIDFFNKGWYDYTGMNFEKMKGRGWESVHHPQVVGTVKERWQQAISQKEPFEMEFPLRRHDGEFRYFLTRINPMRDEDGTVVRWVGVSTDIDEQKQAETQLQQRQKQLETMAEAIPQLVWTNDVNGVIDYHNSRWFDYTGLTEEHSRVGVEWKQVVFPDDLENCLSRWNEALKSGEPFEVNLRFKRALDGAYRWHLVRAIAMKDADGKIIKWFGSCTDIQDQKELEEALEQRVLDRTEKLEEANIRSQANERKFRAIFDQTFQMVGLLNVEGQLLEANQTSLDFMGLKQEDVVGKPFWETPFWMQSAEVKTRLQAAIEEASAGRFVRFETEHFGLQGERDIDFSLKPVVGESGTLLLIAEGRDITERKEAEKRIEAVANELARSNQDLQQFAYAASHDLQEPLRTVISFCALLSKKLSGKIDPDSEKYLGVISEATSRMQQLIKDLLQYASVGSQNKPLEEVELSEPLRIALDALRASISESGAVVTSDSLPRVMGDVTQLSLLLQNLIGNSIKFRGTEPLRVHIGVLKNGDLWELNIKDNGIGFKMDYADRIFVIFQRLHSRSKYEGTGIGLATCKRIVERHGGSIRVESTLGAGSTFFITLQPTEG